uniref:Translation initiation factor eIF-2B subunit delta n=1 Tax=Rhabditophanes sp. KR3021 TaxID=114890 RepID=A0AC35U1T8_9BILA
MTDDAKCRNEVNAQRKAKKAEDKARKEAATKAKKEGKQEQSSVIAKKVVESPDKGAELQKAPSTSAPPKKKPTGESNSSRSKPIKKDPLPKSIPPTTTTIRSLTPIIDTSRVHPSFLSLFSKCDQGIIRGVDEICEEFVFAFQAFLEDYHHQENIPFYEGLMNGTKSSLSYLNSDGKYTFPFALGNIIRQLKKEIIALAKYDNDADSKRHLNGWLENYIDVHFSSADAAIVKFAGDKLRTLPRVLIYGSCPLVEKIILESKLGNNEIDITIVESPIEGNALEFASKLSDKGIETTYTTLNCVGNVMRNVDVVLLGCSAIFSNGYALTQRGCGVIALHAEACNVPVLIAAKTFKFVDLVKTHENKPKEVNALTKEILEAVPDDLITALVTEMRIVPPSSAPAVLKAKQLDYEQ